MQQAAQSVLKPPRPNRLNDLSSKEWLLFQKSWFVHNPPPRRKSVVVHPAKFPETLIQEFIEFFTKKGQTVFDPMVGTGSALVACLRAERRGIGIELNPKYAVIAEEILDEERKTLPKSRGKVPAQRIIVEDARNLRSLRLPPIDYCVTSPPYWDMLRMRGFETQQKRRELAAMDVYYSDLPDDIGNIDDYDEFVEALCEIYRLVYQKLRNKAYMTVIVKNIKKGGRMYPLAWDLGRELSRFFVLKDEKIWCQDNQRLAPYGLGNAWVSNTFHHYCLNFRKEEPV
ncbi:MAG: site-specific DNA-methyltransferase [Armatimonadetes bacterium]|nr:site-specific DNA-methyltransferase [Armatimonadota bacterium]